MSAVADVAGQLTKVIDRSPDDALHTAAERLDDVVTALAAVAEGSADEHLAVAVSAFTQARDAATEAGRALAAAVNHVTDYLHALGFPTAAPATADPTGPLPPTLAAPPDPDAAHARALLAELPTRAPGDKTRGIWLDDDGGTHDLVSGEHDRWYEDAKRYAAQHRLIPSGTMVIASHVEVKFAMRMHQHSVKQATIVVNQTPCPGAYGCRQRLAQFLPRGSQLTVHGPNGFRRTYYGRS